MAGRPSRQSAISSVARHREFLGKELWARSTDPESRKEKNMNDQNRVLIRRGARELTPAESDLINGGFITFSLCTNSPSPDGDQHVGELGC